MLNDATCFKNVYIVTGYTDLRSGIDLKKRLNKLISEFNGNLFCDSSHRQRFENIIKMKNRVVKKIDYQFLATLFLLTADHELWEWSKLHIYLTKVDFKSKAVFFLKLNDVFPLTVSLLLIR